MKHLRDVYEEIERLMEYVEEAHAELKEAKKRKVKGDSLGPDNRLMNYNDFVTFIEYVRDRSGEAISFDVAGLIAFDRLLVAV